MSAQPRRLCNCKEHVLAALALSTWPDTDITWTITDLVPGMTEAELRRACGWGLAQWAKVCGVRPREVTDASQAKILVTCRRIDGGGGVLAECELPQQGSRRVRLWLDVGETWSTEIPSLRAIILADVLWHEFGHALGINHAPQGSANVMAPVYNPAVKSAGSFDISESQRRYGRPVVEPPTSPQPVPTPQPGGNGMGGLLGFLAKIGPLLTQLAPLIELFTKLSSDPNFKTLLDALSKAFANKQTITVDELVSEIQAQRQALKASP